MARPIRLDHPDTFYHVLSTGNEKRDIFCEEEDYLRFLEILGQMVERFRIEIHAFVLMKNHYHLLIRTRQGNLSRAIQWLGVSYVVWFNRKYNRSGHLFRGRFKSFLIENESYFRDMCLYIHGNPLRAGIVEDLYEYRWSSYHTYENENSMALWITTDLILGMFGGDRKSFCKAQHASIEVGRNPFVDLRYGLYLGSRELAEASIRKVKREDNREKPQARFLLKDKEIRPLVFNILQKLGEKDPDSLMSSKRRTKRPNRDVAIYVLCSLGIYTNKEIGSVFNVGYTTVTGAAKRGKQYLEEDKELKEKVQEIMNDI